MTNSELFEKCIKMVLSCTNHKQLQTASKYFTLALPRITDNNNKGSYNCIFLFFYRKQEQKIFEFH